MDTPGSKNYKCDGNYIRRADRWRLLYNIGSQPYCSTPLSSWQPFRQMPLSHVELNMRAHMECKRHERHYICWKWVRRDGVDVLSAETISTYADVEKVCLLWVKVFAAIRPRIARLTSGSLG